MQTDFCLEPKAIVNLSKRFEKLIKMATDEVSCSLDVFLGISGFGIICQALIHIFAVLIFRFEQLKCFSNSHLTPMSLGMWSVGALAIKPLQNTINYSVPNAHAQFDTSATTVIQNR